MSLTSAGRPTARPRTEGPPAGSRFRADIEGLRAVAVLLVMIYHAGVPQLPGGFIGVDVFFVVSGFVITAQLLREVESTGSVNLFAFYGRRAKRLLPAAGVVLLVTSVAAWLVTSRVQWQVIGQDILAAAAYVVNWVFAARSVDYLAEDIDPSPVLHFWSLAVEEQFYLIWPVVILGLVWFLRRRARGSDAVAAAGPLAWVPGRRHLAAGLLAVIVVPSLVFSILYTWWRPSEAFFVTPTRLWELGAGALVALAVGELSSWGRRTGALVAWAGLVAVLTSAALVTASLPWPGIAAFVPVAGTALVIAGGVASSHAGPARLLGLRPLVWVGGLSYSLYLWHWPLLRFWEWQFGPPTLTEGLVIVAASFLPAWLSYRFVESPIRHARALREAPRYALSVGLNFTAVSLIAGLALMQVGTMATAGGSPTGATWSTSESVDRPTGEGTQGRSEDRARATAEATASPSDPDEGVTGSMPPRVPPPLAASAQDPPFFDAVTPDPLLATEDVPAYYHQDCDTNVAGTEVRMCEFGDPDGEVVVAVVGDSKMGQWMPALETIADDRGWLVRFYSKSACAFSSATTMVDGSPNTACVTWSHDVLERLTGPEVPDVVLTSTIRVNAQDSTGEITREALVEGYVDYWTQLGERGVRVVGVSDTPQPMEDPTAYECVADHPDEAAELCTWPSDGGIGSSSLEAAAEQVETASYLDMNPWVCPEGTCFAVYRNVLTYRQGSHITATFARVLAEPMAGELVPLVEVGRG